MTVDAQRLAAVSGLIAEHFGLHYPPERHGDLQRLLTRAARTAGERAVEAYVDSLLAGPPRGPQEAVLAQTLTIGETYFFREPQIFDAIAEHLRPTRSNPSGVPSRLKVWSAGCCTGEEAYSLAILFDRHRDRFPRGQIDILATDLNSQFLQQAAAGIYRPWSFRSAPPWLQPEYFTPLDDGRQQVRPEIRTTVEFAPLNLAAPDYPLIHPGTSGLDLIVCRHVLMYFTPRQFARAVQQLTACLREGGWLVVSTAEVGQIHAPGLVPTRIGPVTVFIKRTVRPQVSTSAVQTATMAWPTFEPPPAVAAETHEPAAQPPPRHVAKPLEIPPAELLAQAREHANQGELNSALTACERVIGQDKLNTVAHFLRASILKEMNDPAGAMSALNRALYLEPDFIAAHLLLASLDHDVGRVTAAERHRRTARRLATRIPAETLLPEADGLTAGQLLALLPATLEETAALPTPQRRVLSPRRITTGSAQRP